jgi:hypothetical protein
MQDCLFTYRHWNHAAGFPLTRRPQFARSPADRIRSKRIAGQDSGFSMSTHGAFEGAVLKAFRSRLNSNRYHPHLAGGATRTVDRQQLWIGFVHPRHDAKIKSGLKSLSARLPT